jgi:hypothetical protein
MVQDLAAPLPSVAVAPRNRCQRRRYRDPVGEAVIRSEGRQSCGTLRALRGAEAQLPATAAVLTAENLDRPDPVGVALCALCALCVRALPAADGVTVAGHRE